MQDLYHRLQGQVRFLAVQAKLNYLAELELVYLENKDLLWYPSWEGTGLKNWLHEQSVRVALNELMPEVQPGENGNTTLSQACENFRPLLSQGGRFCWCGHPFHRHPLI